MKFDATRGNREEVFHAGELSVQERLGVRDEIGPWASKVVRPFLPDPHREFYAGQPFLVAAARDEQGRPWASLLVGEPGFVESPDPRHLEIRATPLRGDALEGCLRAGSHLGLLGIELATRRRNRVNGRVTREQINDEDGSIVFEVGQAFGNCPQFIRARAWERADPVAGQVRRVRRLDAAMREWIRSADTFFIATGHRGDEEAASSGMDASHRGGAPGFVVVDDAPECVEHAGTRLVFPDYAGNNHFNTIGNLVSDPRAGLLFVDFETGGMLQLTGRASIDWDSLALAEHPGAQRLVVFELDEAVALPGVLPLRWNAADESLREMKLAKKIRESDDVVSFVLEAADGEGLTGFDPGQHLPVELDVPGQPDPVRRSYSLSGAPADAAGRYRISVKREPLGLASRHLHDSLEVGDILRARPPAGDFVLGASDRPVALVSAGVGVTPMLAMLHDIVARQDPRATHFVHVARDGMHHALADEVRELASAAPDARLRVFYSRPRSQDEPGRDFDFEGRIDAERLAGLLPRDADVYLCGPVAFMAGLHQGLEAAGVPPGRIHSESFGPRG